MAELPAWIPCPCCENYWCTIHGKHAHECECPPIEDWLHSPYSAAPKSNESAWQVKLMLTNVWDDTFLVVVFNAYGRQYAHRKLFVSNKDGATILMERVRQAIAEDQNWSPVGSKHWRPHKPAWRSQCEADEKKPKSI